MSLSEILENMSSSASFLGPPNPLFIPDLESSWETSFKELGSFLGLSILLEAFRLAKWEGREELRPGTWLMLVIDFLKESVAYFSHDSFCLETNEKSKTKEEEEDY